MQTPNLSGRDVRALVKPRKRRPRGVRITITALADPPTFLDDSFEILRHPELFRLLRERQTPPAATT